MGQLSSPSQLLTSAIASKEDLAAPAAEGNPCFANLNPPRQDFGASAQENLDPQQTRSALLACLSGSTNNEGRLEATHLKQVVDAISNKLQAEGHKLPENFPLLLLAIAAKESKHIPDAISPKGGRFGLFQIGRDAVKQVQENLAFAPQGFSPSNREKLLDPIVNTEIAARYLVFCLKMLGGDVELALGGFNQGPYGIKNALNKSTPASERTLEKGGKYASHVLSILSNYETQLALKPNESQPESG